MCLTFLLHMVIHISIKTLSVEIKYTNVYSHNVPQIGNLSSIKATQSVVSYLSCGCTIRVLVHIRHSAFKSIIYVYIYIIVSQSAAEVVAAGRISVRFPSHMTHTIARFIF